MSTSEPEELETQLNETIRLLMTRTGRRQADVAEVIGITRASLSQRLLGHSAWKLNDLPKVATYFGVTVCELLSGYAAIAQADRLPPAKGSDGQTRL
ncbi:BetR domain-containing protein [Streptomyces sp. PanSC19]|uniref:helix-turn-helix domain-containing protein n=1 Tax=Streptomyces sp. PanSC19 TaxID=1520455 RepID=UPI000F4A2E52|nr:helix-turn-helix transcriptional regulator [Streptomyces sp. PanSC19]ROQ22696.1 BetR domain-containing protein [Streptomyces sp. PanSC19]